MVFVQPTPQELLKHHLCYEIWMLKEMFERTRAPNSDKILQNALIESICVHARCLLEFLNDSGGAVKYTDNSFAASWMTKGSRASLLNQELNNQISHLMDGRTDQDSFKINVLERIELMNIISAKYGEFKNALKPEFKSFVTHDLPLIYVSQPAPPSATNHIIVSITGPSGPT